jgi:hypothetical protein
MPTMNQRRVTKSCTSCGEKFPREEFPVRTARTDRRWPVCTACYPEYRKRLNAISEESKQRVRARRASGLPVDVEKTPPLPVGPIRRWLVDELGVPPIDAELTIEDRGKVKQIAEWLRTNDRQIHRWRSGESETTDFDTFDRCLCEAGIPWKLRELFPELWQFDDVAVA